MLTATKAAPLIKEYMESLTDADTIMSEDGERDDDDDIE